MFQSPPPPGINVPTQNGSGALQGAAPQQNGNGIASSGTPQQN
eukprot:COSAG05_NODE_10194_length_578_cov_1.098121_1_plen_42_part_01